MQDQISAAVLNELAAVRGGPCVSIFLPTHFAGTQVRQDEPRLDALLESAQARLTELGIRSASARELVADARRRAMQPRFWHDRTQGLALFFKGALVRQFRTPGPLAEQVVVGDGFYLRPLLPYAVTSDRFFVLAIGQHDPQLWRGSQFELQQVETPDLPAGIEEVMHEAVSEGVLVQSLGGERSRNLYYGHGGQADVHKSDLERYLRDVSQAVEERLHGETAPLVLAGVGSTVAAYRQVQRYPHLVDTAVLGAVGSLAPYVLHEKAWAAALPALEQPRREALARLSRLNGSLLVKQQPVEILRAAREGRVEALLVSPQAQAFGRCDPVSGAVELTFKPQSDDVDLVNLMILETLRHRGVAYEAPAEIFAALLRY